jgi:two-component system, response regulator
MTSSDVKQEFGSSVKSWRGRRAISQEELAARAGLHRTYISDVERGVRNVSLESIEKLARALEVPVATLISNATRATGEPGSRHCVDVSELVDILLVEDDPNDEAMALQALKRLAITNRIHVAHDGVEALDYLLGTGADARRPDQDRPQVILLDLYLPKISGIEVLQRIKADPRTRSIPVVVLTGSNYERDIALSRELGSEAYIVKPVDILNLTGVTSRLSLHWALLKSTHEGQAEMPGPLHLSPSRDRADASFAAQDASS